MGNTPWPLTLLSSCSLHPVLYMCWCFGSDGMWGLCGGLFCCLWFFFSSLSLYLYRRESAETELLDPYDSSASAAVMTFLKQIWSRCELCNISSQKRNWIVKFVANANVCKENCRSGILKTFSFGLFVFNFVHLRCVTLLMRRLR